MSKSAKYTHEVKCGICEKMFIPRNAAQKYCCDRCSHIAAYLNRPYALTIGRTAAIEHYGEIFDDPLRSIGKSRYMPHIRYIYTWCIANQKTTFTEAEISQGFSGKLDYYVLGAIHRRHDVVHICGEREIIGVGSKHVSVWRFVLDGCKEIMRLE